MLEIKGKYNSAIIYAKELEKGAIGQLTALCNQEFMAGEKIRIMPDAHAGSVCVVGTTMTVRDKIVPNLVGVDIGCGMELVKLGIGRMDLKKLDRVIRENVPSGFALRKEPHRFAKELRISELSCQKALNPSKVLHSLGTLGGGNHFIELARDEEREDLYLIIHSGSRNPGLQTATYHQNIAAQGRPENVPFELAYLTGQNFAAYVHDMEIMQEYADWNRKAMADEILRGMKWKAEDSFSTIHNYLDTANMILRKGAISAQKGERALIPLNMRDGSLLCEGLGNADWNYSAPHGAGRIFSRKEAREKLTLTQYKQAMKGIYSTSISRNTIDESPQTYKAMGDIVDQIGETVKIKAVLKPVYNFKAGGE